MVAGTTLRFVLLMVLLLVSCGHVLDRIARNAVLPKGMGTYGCLFAAGADPYHDAGVELLFTVSAQAKAFDACMARYDPSLPWWVAIAWPAMLLAVAAVLFRLTPRWKTRRSRVVPLEKADADHGIARTLAALSATAGLPRPPRVVVDPAAASTGAVVFGSNRRPVVCLHGGLLTRRHTDPAGFRAVLLHELAHIRNKDVTLTHATIALWRAFVAVVLLPGAVYGVHGVLNQRKLSQPLELPSVTRNLELLALLVALVYLARSDVLRSREIHADRAALRWGADRSGWAFPAVAATAPPRGAVRRALASFAEQWRTHPRWEVRRESLDDPAVLFGLRPLPLLVTGAAATLIGSLLNETTSLLANSRSWDVAKALATAALVTGVVGVAVWRAVAHALLTGRRVPSGVRAGLWLGTGMALGELLVDDLTLSRWLPDRPAPLLLMVVAGTALVWWTAQCARLWAGAWRGRSVLPPMLLCLAGLCLLLAAWYAWWRESGVFYAMGQPLDFPAAAEAHGRFTVPEGFRSWYGTLLVNLLAESHRPLSLPALAALSLVPLLARLIRPGTGTPPWVRRATGGGDVPGWPPGPRPPRVRVLLQSALLGVAAGAAAFVGVAAALHARLVSGRLPTADHAVTYYGWVVLTVALAQTAAAAVAASRSSGHHRLPAALAAAVVAAPVTFAGLALSDSVSGCVRPLAALGQACRPGVAGPSWSMLPYLLGPSLVLGAGGALFAAAAVSGAGAVRQWRRTGTRTAAGRAVPPRPAAPPGEWQPGGASSAGRLVVAAVCAAALAVSVLATVPRLGDGRDAKASVASSRPAAGPPPPRSPLVRRIQVLAWYGHGGQDLLDRSAKVSLAYVRLLKDAGGEIDNDRVRPHCTALSGVARDSAAFFRVPDAQAQEQWEKYIAQLAAAGRLCKESTDRSDGDLLVQSVDSTVRAAGFLLRATARVKEVARVGEPFT
ncbi:hypothetical protein GCM10010218_23890 [Streptomyces mashuensis]|uniref:Peptidase M48 domain-containing protein n=1 Tax=Streptomyces mashuensis TaxID=33904 RepID=A0A919EBE9_9ACTN|nr:M48 family metalloprotease [Streptomyces mashuensis]GHF42020.1 hypothetical protein GCM10010218_23890 [Streptomyces mashuensis]